MKFVVAFHVNMLQHIQLPVNWINSKHEKYLLKLFDLFNIANNNIISTFKTWLMFGNDFCDVEMKSRCHLKFLSRHPCNYSKAYRIILQKMSEKDLIHDCPLAFPARGQSWNKNSRKRQLFKKLLVQTRVENNFLFNFLR